MSGILNSELDSELESISHHASDRANQYNIPRSITPPIFNERGRRNRNAEYVKIQRNIRKKELSNLRNLHLVRNSVIKKTRKNRKNRRNRRYTL